MTLECSSSWCRRAATAAVVGFLLLGCGHSTPPHAPPIAAKPPASEYAELFAEVTKVRALQPTSSVCVEHLDDDAFAGKVKSLGAKDVRGAVFDPASHTIVVKRSFEAAKELEYDVAHAYHDLLIEDHFPGPHTPVPDAEALAIRAELLASDWDLVARGWGALKRAEPVARAIVGASSPPPDGMLGIIRPERELPQPREFVAPDGVEFLSALYRTGGFPLVDAMFAHPPVDGRALFDAQAWVDGLERATFALPSLDAVAGETVVVETFGVARLLGALGRAGVADADASKLARTLRYGTSEVLRSSRGDSLARIVLVFDDANHAKALLDVVDQAKRDGKRRATLLDGDQVGGHDRVVVIAWNGTSSAERRVADALAVVPGVRRDPPPLGVVHLVPLPIAAASLRVAEVRGDVVLVPNLGLRITAPGDFHARPEPQGLVDLESTHHARLLVRIWEGMAREVAIATTLRGLGDATSPAEVPPAELPPAPWVRSDYESGRTRLVFVTRPICNAHARFEVVAFVAAADASPAAKWAVNLDLSKVEASAYCAALAEERTEWTFPVKWPPTAPRK